MLCSYSIRCWDSNPQPLGDESPPIITRLGLPPKEKKKQLLLQPLVHDF